MLLGTQGRRQLAALGGVSLIGIEMAVSILVGYYGGRWLDGKFGTSPWLEWIGFAFGVAAGFRSLYRIAQREQKKLANDSAKSEDDPTNDSTPKP